MSVLPHRNAPKERNGIRNTIVTGMTQAAGRQYTVVAINVAAGIAHQRIDGRKANGTNR
jgi:hypothetical protein